MRHLLIGLLGLAALAGATLGLAPASPAQAQDWPWCADLSGPKGGGGTNCGFASWEQCQVNLRGIGGWCYPNPYYRAEASHRPRYRHRYRHRLR